MYMAETFHITPAGAVAFNTFGAQTAPTVAEALIERHELDPHAVTLITHQASQKLIDAWKARPGLAGATFLNTILQYGNPALAGVPLTLAARGSEVTTDHLILFCLGVQQQASAVLLGRQPSDVFDLGRGAPVRVAVRRRAQLRRARRRRRPLRAGSGPRARGRARRDGGRRPPRPR